MARVDEDQDCSLNSEDPDEELTEEKLVKTLQEQHLNLASLKTSSSPWNEENLHKFEQLNDIIDGKNMTLVRSVGNLLIELDFLDVCVVIWNYCHKTKTYLTSDIYRMMKSVLWNYSDQFPKLAEAAFRQKKLINCCMKELQKLDNTDMSDDNKLYLIKATLSFLYNALRLYEPNSGLIRQDGGVQEIMKFSKSSDVSLKIYSMILLAHCIKHEEEHKLSASNDVIDFFVHLLLDSMNCHENERNSEGFTTAEMLTGLDKLALNDDNKKSIVDAGILHLLERMLRDKSFSKDETIVAANLLYTLSFHPDNKTKIQENKCLLRTVQAIQNCPDYTSTDAAILRACHGILFNIHIITNKQTEITTVSVSSRDVLSEAANTNKEPILMTKGHIMISYQWNVQDTMLKVRDGIRSNGYDVWMDIENMKGGSLLDGMAEAVENASVVIIAMTEAYQNSNNCRLEAEYACNLGIPIIPLMLQSHYKPHGWLGLIQGMKLYVDFSNEIDGLDGPLEKLMENLKALFGKK